MGQAYGDELDAFWSSRITQRTHRRLRWESSSECRRLRVGTRAGEQGWDEFKDAWKVISTSDEVRDLVAAGFSSPVTCSDAAASSSPGVRDLGPGRDLRPAA